MISREFLEWFDTLDPNLGDREEDTSSRVLLGSGRRFEPISKAPFDQARRPTLPSTGQRKRPVKRIPNAGSSKHAPPAGRLPRVASLRPRDHMNRKKPAKRSPVVPSPRRTMYTYSNQGPFPGIPFFKELFKTKTIRIVPCLVFFESHILWFGQDSRTRQMFKDVRALTAQYNEVLQSLKGDGSKGVPYFNQLPVAVEQVHKRDSLVAISSSSELIETIEKWCKAFTQKRILQPGLIMSYASIARGTTTTKWKSVAKTGTAPAPSEAFVACTNLAEELSTDAMHYCELVCEFSIDRSNRMCLAGVSNFVQKPRKRKPKAPVLSTPQVKYPTWCIGDACKKTGCEDLTSKYPVVYKTILGYRKDVLKRSNNPTLISEDSRMYETVKVCKTCSKELNEYVVIQAEADRARKQQEAKSRKEEETRSLLMKQKLDEEKHKEDEEMRRREKEVAELAERMAKQQASFEHRLKTSRLGGVREEPTRKSGMAPEQTSAHPNHDNSAQPPRRARKIHDIYEITCAAYFSNGEEKNLLSMRVMEILRQGDSVRLHASLDENSNSAEECRLVLRSIYLEFRGLCKDQGYFPDVPCDGKEAVMALEGGPIHELDQS